MTKVSLTVNGSVLSAEVEPRTHLADLLRETHNLTGTHIGCEHGVAAPARCSSTARQYALASPSPSLARTPGSPRSKASTTMRSQAS